MENKNLKKMTMIAGIAAAVLVIVLIVSILISKNMRYTLLQESITVELGTVDELILEPEDFFDVKEDLMEKITFDVSEVDLTAVGTYNAYAKLNGQEYTIQVIIEDTTAPKVEFVERSIFTNDITKLENCSSMFKEVSEASEYTTKLIRFEKEDNLCELNELEMENLLGKIALPGVEEELLSLGTTDVPTEEGIYRSVLEIKDACGNTSYEEVYVILDKTAASINEVEDLVVYVDAEDKLTEKPELDLSKYKGVDNVDGALTSDDLKIELTCTDENAHKWITRVSYIDRAGNESVGEFLITVKVGKGNGSSTGGGSNNGGGNTGGGSSNSGNAGGGSYDPADANRDGVVDMEEGNAYISPDKQACIDAGYGVVVSFNNGEYYMVLTHTGGYVNGVHGMDILSNYLAERGLRGNIGSHSSDTENDLVWYKATNIYEIPTEEIWE